MFKLQRSIWFMAAALSWSLPAFAQSAPAAAPADGDDLEVPVTPSTVPGAAVSKPSPGAAQPSPPAPSKTVPPAPASAPAGAAAEAETAELRRELEELRARVNADERVKKAEPDQAVIGSAKSSTIAASDVNPNIRSAYSRPVLYGFHLGGYLQAQYFASQLSEDQLSQDGSPLNQNQFSLRRARIQFDEGWEYASATFELDANTIHGVNVGIRRAEASLLYRGQNTDKMPPLVMLTAGVTDTPFGFELVELTRARPFMERTLGSLSLFPTEADIGAKVSGAVSFLRYAFSIMNGQPVNNLAGTFSSDPNAAKDYTGRVGIDVKPVPALSLSGGTSFLHGTGFHPGQSATKPSITWFDSNEDQILTPNELQGTAGTAATPSQNFHRWLYGLDLQLELNTSFGSTRLYGEAFVGANMDRGLLIADPVLSGQDMRESGWYLAFVQDVTRFGLVGFRASVYDPNSDFLDTRAGRQIPTSYAVRTYSPLVAVHTGNRAQLSFQYDFILDNLARNALGVPTDAKNNQWTLRLQVAL